MLHIGSRDKRDSQVRLHDTEVPTGQGNPHDMAWAQVLCGDYILSEMLLTAPLPCIRLNFLVGQSTMSGAGEKL